MFGDGDNKEWSIFGGKSGKKDKKKDSKKDSKKKDSKKKDSKKKDSGKKVKKPEEKKNGFSNPKFAQRPAEAKPEVKKVPIVLGYKDAFTYDKKNTFEVHYKNQKVKGTYIRSSKTNMIRISDSMYLNDVIKDMDPEVTAAEIKENTKFYPVQLQIAGANRLLTNKE